MALNKMDESLIWVVIAIFTFILGVALGLILEAELSQETLDNICITLAENKTAIGQVQVDGTLLCTIPSFDLTHNINIQRGGRG